MFERVKAAFRKKALSLLNIFGGIYANVPISNLGNYESYLKAGTGRIWALWKACDIIAQAVMDTPTQLVRASSGTEAKNPEIGRLLRYPNPYQTFAELVYLTVMHLKFTGNAFWLKDSNRTDGTRPGTIWSLNPKRVRIIPGVSTMVDHYEFQASGEIKKLAFDEVIHFKRPHPDNDYWGLGDVEAGTQLFNDFLNRDDWQARFWNNGASPSGLMVLDDNVSITREEWAKVKAEWVHEYGGKANAGKTAWINGKWRYQQLGLSAHDMQDLEKLNLSLKQIFMLLGVPLSVMGMENAAAYATAAIDMVRFRAYTVKPMVKILADTINTDLITDWSDDLELRWTVSGLINVGAVVQDYAPLFDRGVISINEFRKQIGLQTIDEPLFDQHFINAGLVPLDLSGVADLGQTERQAQQMTARFVEDALKQRNGENGKSDHLLAGLVMDGQQDVTKQIKSLEDVSMRMLGVLDKINDKPVSEIKSEPIQIPAPIVNVPAQPPMSVNVELKMPDKKPVSKQVTAKRNDDGTLTATIVEE